MKKSYLYAGVAIFCWSSVATVAKLLLGDINSTQLLWISSLLAALFLLVVNVANGKIKMLKGFKPKEYAVVILIGLPGSLLYYMFFYAGADLMPASQAFIVNYLWPIMSVVFACVILKERMTVKKAIAIIVSFAGVGIVTGTELVSLNGKTLTGAVLCILGAVSYGLFTALNQRFNYDKSISVMLTYFATFAITCVMVIASGDLFVPKPVQLIGFAWNGMFTVGLANTLWMMALEKGNTAKISNLAYITPFLSLVWTSLVLKEKISINSVIGLVVIVLGILIQLKNGKKTETE